MASLLDQAVAQIDGSAGIEGVLTDAAIASMTDGQLEEMIHLSNIMPANIETKDKAEQELERWKRLLTKKDVTLGARRNNIVRNANACKAKLQLFERPGPAGWRHRVSGGFCRRWQPRRMPPPCRRG